MRHTRRDIPDGEVGEILRVAMKSNTRQKVNYRPEDVGIQLHYYTDTPKGILERLDRGEVIWDIGMKTLKFFCNDDDDS